MAKTPKNHGKPGIPAQDAQPPVMGLKLGRAEASVSGRASALCESLKPTNQSPYNRRKK